MCVCACAHMCTHAQSVSGGWAPQVRCTGFPRKIGRVLLSKGVGTLEWQEALIERGVA